MNIAKFIDGFNRRRSPLAADDGTPAVRPPSPAGQSCQVYWGSHGCMLPQGHPPEIPHVCDCSYDVFTGDLLPHDDVAGNGNVGRAPYYGPETTFYGEDAAR